MKTSWWYAVLFAVGCGGSSMTVDEYASEQVKILCEFEVKCCKTVANAVVYTDVASCVTAQTANKQAELADSKARIAAGTLKFSAGTAAHCNSVVKALLSSCANSINESTDTGACQNVFVGTVAVGAPCANSDTECVAGAECIDQTCKKFLASGEICASSDSKAYPSCAHGLQCDYNVSMTCITPKAAGAECTESAQCASYHCKTTCTPESTPVTEQCEQQPTA